MFLKLKSKKKTLGYKCYINLLDELFRFFLLLCAAYVVIYDNFQHNKHVLISTPWVLESSGAAVRDFIIDHFLSGRLSQ